MKLCVDVGNTTIGLGFYKDNELIYKFSLGTSIEKMCDEYSASIKLLLEENKINGEEVKDVLYASVVPSLNEILLYVIAKLFPNSTIYELDSSSPHEITMAIDNPHEVGSDLIADLVGARNKYELPLLIIDLGTATKLLLLDKDGAFKSALIMPGVEVSAKSLFSKAALLPEVDLSTYSTLLDSKNTINCIKHGILFGHVESIKGLANKYENELGYSLNKVVTGGNANLLKGLLNEKEYIFDDNLVLDGELIILNRLNGGSK